MWNTSVKIEYIAGLIVDALENYSVNRENAQFRLVIEELRNHFTNCSEQEITDIISLCMKMYSSMQGNIEMGFLIESHDKAKQIEEVMKEMVRMKVCGKYQ